MVKQGTVTGREVTTNKDGDTPRLMLQVRFSSDADIQTVEYVPLPGQDESPINGSRVYVIGIDESYKIAIAVNDGVEPTSATGEKYLYSVDDTGVVQAILKLYKSGIIEINGNADFAVRFDALDTALQTMLTALNADIIIAGGAGSSTLDISAAKVNEVKLP